MSFIWILMTNFGNMMHFDVEQAIVISRVSGGITPFKTEIDNKRVLAVAVDGVPIPLSVMCAVIAAYTESYKIVTQRVYEQTVNFWKKVGYEPKDINLSDTTRADYRNIFSDGLVSSFERMNKDGSALTTVLALLDEEDYFPA